ncbi:uroporphyrin-III C-methyltransferase [Rhodobium orientis]|uniref:uroporphyrinogen-III C-methyltransferase n=1 Tax=Rhodobium orientis TaxID=34017 RepID=A0A327JSG8_9HYPH|nr:uroporphyrinogen-III C-methyltransferase [Rhodobium orientis]MBB4303271.1 uroporphyrin-III C-methyltransferase [Rhodobium orientis]MBK5951630.1 uroporphyrinogen-III C-methyltransferase [Rhodobium orientis]RAI27832.1 uroporphyrinogen-III C-methyltransferase [Rhodobium orientis]
MSGKVFLIGAGPGDPEYLTLKALRVLRDADVVVFDRLVSPEILAMVPPDVRRIDVGKAPNAHAVPQDRINAILVDLAARGLTVARLKGGDPLVFGRGSEEAAALAEAGIAVDYVPGITAAQGAAAATGIPLTHRGLACGVRYVTGHRARNRPLDLDWQSLADEETTLVVYMGVANIAEIADRLTAHGLPADTPVMAIANATTPREQRLVSQLDRIGADVALGGLEAPVLFIIGRVVSLYRELPDCLPVAAMLAETRVAGHG